MAPSGHTAGTGSQRQKKHDAPDFSLTSEESEVPEGSVVSQHPSQPFSGGCQHLQSRDDPSRGKSQSSGGWTRCPTA